MLMYCFGGCLWGFVRGLLGSENREQIKAKYGITEVCVCACVALRIGGVCGLCAVQA